VVFGVVTRCLQSACSKFIQHNDEVNTNNTTGDKP